MYQNKYTSLKMVREFCTSGSTRTSYHYTDTESPIAVPPDSRATTSLAPSVATNLCQVNLGPGIGIP